MTIWFTAAQETTTEGAETTADGEEFAPSTDAWENGETIPTRYTCDGENVSPPFPISNPPEEAEAFALVMDDPDPPNPPFVHWLLWNVPADASYLPENVPPARRSTTSAARCRARTEPGNSATSAPASRRATRSTPTCSASTRSKRRLSWTRPEYQQVVDAVLQNAIARSQYVGQYERSAAETTTE